MRQRRAERGARADKRRELKVQLTAKATEAALRTMFLMNAGASIAVLTWLQVVWKEDADHPLILWLCASGGSFALALFLMPGMVLAHVDALHDEFSSKTPRWQRSGVTTIINVGFVLQGLLFTLGIGVALIGVLRTQGIVF